MRSKGKSNGERQPAQPKPRQPPLSIKPKERPASKGRVHKGRTRS